MEQLPVFRAPMRSRDDDVPLGVATERALEKGVCGVGGRLARSPDSLGEAVELTDRTLGEMAARRLERFAEAPEDSFVWTRDAYEFLWLGRLGGHWRYDSAPGAWAVDLVNIRPCTWSGVPIPHDQVPASVHATFARGGRNWQRIRATDASSASARIWSRYRPDRSDQVTRAVG